MNITATEVAYKMTASANASSINVTGGLSIGTNQVTFSYATPPTIAYSFMVKVRSGQTIDFNFQNGQVTGGDPGQQQAGSLPIVGNVVTGGDMVFSFTFRNPDTGVVQTREVLVTVADGNTADQINTLAAEALTFDVVTSRFYEFSAEPGPALTFTARAGNINDTSLNLGYTNGTATGPTPQPTSSAESTGLVATEVVRINGLPWDQADFEGAPLPVASKIYSILARHIEGAGSLKFDALASAVILAPKDFSMMSSAVGSLQFAGQSVTFESTGGDAIVLFDIHAG